MNYIIKTDLSFITEKLLEEYNRVYSIVKADQINIRKPGNLSDTDGISYGAGSLFNGEKVFDNDRSWDSYINSLNIPYTTRAIKDIEQLVGYVHGAKVGRARYMALKPKSCLTYHIDKDNIVRVHIPLITNNQCFFVNDDKVGRMDVPGNVYFFDSTVRHTAVNASRETRVHIVVNCYV